MQAVPLAAGAAVAVALSLQKSEPLFELMKSGIGVQVFEGEPHDRATYRAVVHRLVEPDKRLVQVTESRVNLPDGTVLFRWSPFDHFAITDLAPAERTGANVNWTHGNALDIDADGNLIVSFRNLDEITKIDAVSGAVIWRMGGRRNQFAFPDSPVPAFSHQHGARMSSAGRLILLDNIGNPDESRSERYTVNEATRTARLEHSYGSIPGAVTQIGGSVQSLAGGRTMVSFGTAGRVEEYDAAGRVTWSIQGHAGYVFRAQRILSLYTPGVGTSR